MTSIPAMARKSSKTSSLVPDGDKTPSSRNMSIYEKIPVFADVRDKTEGETIIMTTRSLIGPVNMLATVRVVSNKSCPDNVRASL